MLRNWKVPQIMIPIGIAAVSTASVLIRFAQGYTSSLTIAAFRLAIAVLILMPYTAAFHRKELLSLSRRDFGSAMASGVLLAVHFASWISSLEFTSVASSVVLVSTTPLWVAAASPLLLGERLKPGQIGGLLLALTGGILIGISDSCLGGWLSWNCLAGEINLSRETLQGDLLALLGAVSGAGYLMIGRRLRKTLSLAPYVLLVYGAAAVLLLLAMLIRDGMPGMLPAKVYLWLLLLAIIPQLVGHSIFNWALRYLPAGYVSVTLLGEPVGSTLLAYIFLKEIPGGLKIIGAILILVGIVSASLPPQNSRNRLGLE